MKHKHVLDFLIRLHERCCFQTREGGHTGKASNSELRRWFKQGAVQINGEAYEWNDPVPFTWHSLVLFPKSKHRVTLL